VEPPLGMGSAVLALARYCTTTPLPGVSATR
jgi:hypothetical protein